MSEPRPRTDEAETPPGEGQPRDTPRWRLSRRAWILAGAGVAALILAIVVIVVRSNTDSVIFEDDFSSSASGWQEWSVNGESTGGFYNDGAYNVSAEAGDAAGGDPEGASSLHPSAPPSINIQVETRGVEGSAGYGILCRSTATSWYSFIVEGESVTIWRQDSSGGDSLASGTAQIDVDGTNELFATCDGNEDQGYVYLQLLVNGEQVASATDRTPLPAGTVGLFVDSRQTNIAAEVQFDNFVVTKV